MRLRPWALQVVLPREFGVGRVERMGVRPTPCALGRSRRRRQTTPPELLLLKEPVSLACRSPESAPRHGARVIVGQAVRLCGEGGIRILHDAQRSQLMPSHPRSDSNRCSPKPCVPAWMA